MATILQVIQNFCYRSNLTAPSSIVGVTTASERHYLSLFQYIGDDLRNRPMIWPQLKRSYTFTTVTSQSKYRLPGDFYRLLPETQWDVTNVWPLQGPISDSEMIGAQFGVVNLETRKRYRIVGPVAHLYSTSPYSQRAAGVFEIDPTASNDTDQLFLAYISANWVWPRDWVTTTSYTAGDIRSGDRYVYRAATTATSGSTRPSHSTGTVSDGGVDWAVYNEPYPVDTTNSALNDADLCLFDSDLMVDGMRWAYLRSKGQDYQQERSDWESKIRNALGRFDDIVRVNLADALEQDEDWPIVSPGGWPV